eukprot:3580085-Pyramimonas_sp.AAC.1
MPGGLLPTYVHVGTYGSLGGLALGFKHANRKECTTRQSPPTLPLKRAERPSFHCRLRYTDLTTC